MGPFVSVRWYLVGRWTLGRGWMAIRCVVGVRAAISGWTRDVGLWTLVGRDASSGCAFGATWPVLPKRVGPELTPDPGRFWVCTRHIAVRNGQKKSCAAHPLLHSSNLKAKG